MGFYAEHMQNEGSIFGPKRINTLFAFAYATPIFSNVSRKHIHIRFPLLASSGKSRLYPTFSISSSDAEESPLHRNNGGGGGSSGNSGKNSNSNSLYNVPYQSPSRNTNTVSSIGSASYQQQQQQHPQQQHRSLHQHQHNHLPPHHQSHTAKKHQQQLYQQQQQPKHINLGGSTYKANQQQVGLSDTPSSSDNGCGSEATLTDTELAATVATSTVAQGKHFRCAIIRNDLCYFALSILSISISVSARNFARKRPGHIYFDNTNI